MKRFFVLYLSYLTLALPTIMAAQILAVDYIPITKSDSQESSGRMRPKWSKIHSPPIQRLVREKYTVTWTTEKVLPKGTMVEFRYVQERQAKVIHSLKVTYPISVSGQRTPTFTIGEKSFKKGGSVVRYEVRIWSGNTLIGQAHSSTWRALENTP